MPNKFPDGHFYSPIVNVNYLVQSQARIWPEKPEILGVDFNDASHLEWLLEILPKYMNDYDLYPLEAKGEQDFYIQNTIFSWLDSRLLYSAVRHYQPKRIIEIGSGMSSLLVADVNRQFFNEEIEFICIEPYPKEFLVKGVKGISNLIQEKVEDVSLSIFEQLNSGDILFIDSSHVSKTGSDVNHIYFEIVPRLANGVIIHIHDIFLPADYPKKWAIEQGRSWNEQYLVRALLMYTKAFEVLFGCSYALYNYPAQVRELLQGQLYGGGSLWLRKIINE
jgi:predicted O-methyltransferase YrrM